MFINELILRLKKLVDKHGDLEIYIGDDDFGYWKPTEIIIDEMLIDDIERTTIKNIPVSSKKKTNTKKVFVIGLTNEEEEDDDEHV